MNFGSLLLALTFCCCCCEFALSQRGFGDTGAMYNNVMRRVDDLTYEFQAKLRDLSDEVQAQHSRTSRTVAQLKASVETIMLVMQQLLGGCAFPRLYIIKHLIRKRAFKTTTGTVLYLCVPRRRHNYSRLQNKLAF